jgi:hypothetical protein
MDKISIVKKRRRYRIIKLRRFEMKDSLEYLTNHEDSARDKAVSANLDGQKYPFIMSMA